ncbi:MAG: CDP-glycerol glycerophosphotransferase family protein [Clostridiales bacterium]|nr:CDP-glycerol glycerophosphotransferase family protein [Clostridiales bacterium]
MVNLYIDPGTGSMLFTILISAISAVVYVVRILWIKAKNMAGVKNQNERNAKRIPIVMFSDNKRYWSTFRPICDELEKRGQKAVYMTASPDDPALDSKYKNIKCEFIGEGNKAFAKMNMLNAGIVLSTTPSLDVFQWKRSKTVDHYVHILHACGDISLYRLYGLDYYDALLLSGDFQEKQVRELERQRNLPAKEIRMVGIPYLDTMYEHAKTYEAKKSDVTTVLLSPSWGASSLLVKYGSSLIDRLIETGYDIIIRPHPQSFTADKETIDSLMAKYPESKRLHWNRDNNNFDVLARSDIMISDYSGIMYDFAFIFNKPVIYTNAEFKKDPYDAWCIEGETWMLSTIRKLGKELNSGNIGQVKELIDSCIKESRQSAKILEARDETWCNIGKSASLTADYLIEKLAELEKKDKPSVETEGKK